MPKKFAFRIWGRIEEVVGIGFLAVASLIRDDLDPAGTEVRSEICDTRDDAEAALRVLLVEMGEGVRRAGGRIVDVETDGI